MIKPYHTGAFRHGTNYDVDDVTNGFYFIQIKQTFAKMLLYKNSIEVIYTCTLLKILHLLIT